MLRLEPGIALRCAGYFSGGRLILEMAQVDVGLFGVFDEALGDGEK
ncbi:MULTISPECIES: hypothetical protein [unclassified Rhizobium]|nr:MULTISPECIES: hypothetical protein [unclassified Rhizobium]